nr:hypothetical protein Itr_chr02CG03510 [Ipomoea trifida]
MGNILRVLYIRSKARRRKKVIADPKLEEGRRSSQIRSSKLEVVTAIVRLTFIADPKEEE